MQKFKLLGITGVNWKSFNSGHYDLWCSTRCHQGLFGTSLCVCSDFFTHRKVMFSEAWVSNSVHRGKSAPRGRGSLRGGSGGLLPGGGLLLGARVWSPRGSADGDVCSQTSTVLISSGDHCRSRYASYWNAFLLLQVFVGHYEIVTKQNKATAYLKFLDIL